MKLSSPPFERPKIGLALGSGSARGWAHIGVIRELQDIGIHIDVVAGCSIGALVGGAFACGKLDILEAWALSLTRRTIAGYMDPGFGAGGIIRGTRIMDTLKYLGLEASIENFELPFGAVASEMTQGEEIWIEQGPFLEAVRASAALPGLVCPHFYQNKWLLDGGLVNPVPVALARKLGCSKVIAVNLNHDLLGAKEEPTRATSLLSWMHEASKKLPSFLGYSLEEAFPAPSTVPSPYAQTAATPGYRQVLCSMMNIMQDRVTRYRMHIEPADIELQPNLSHLGVMDFHFAVASIAEGRRIVRENASTILKQTEAVVEMCTTSSDKG
jgi:NTE family protein